MVQTFVFIFYLALNVVPANTTQFNIEMHNPSNDQEVVVLDFKRQNDQWTVVPSHKPKETLFFHFDKDNVCYIKDGEQGKEDRVDLLTKLNITPNHKKWKKVTKVEFKPKKQGEAPDKLVFAISKKGKKKRVISLDKDSAPEMSKMVPKMEVSWK
jgi:hypothetical protein